MDKLKEKIQSLPLTSGVYLYKDAQGTIIYVGKAVNLRRRVESYFRPQNRSLKTGFLVGNAVDIEVIETASEAEALLLEASLIKRHQPKYNSTLKDGRTYPYIQITKEEFPLVSVVRMSTRKYKDLAADFYGPYVNAHLIREAMAIIRKIFSFRSCEPFGRKLCLDYHIGLCAGPCEGKISKEDYARNIRSVRLIFDGNKAVLYRQLRQEMEGLAKKKDYENAAKVRDQIRAIGALYSGTKDINYFKEAEQLQRALNLPKAPIRIECFDISNIMGNQAVGSMVSFWNGSPDKNNYRRFRIKTVSGIDDSGMMGEIVRRRYSRLKNEGTLFPDLVLIDGGKGQLGAAMDELKKLEIDIPVVALAKREEELFLPGRRSSVILPPDSLGLRLVMRVRDEAHRFAISYHRLLRSKAALNTTLLLLGIILLSPACALDQKAVKNLSSANNTVDNFALLDQEGKFHELYRYSDKKAVVLISQGVGCPIVRKSISYLRELKEMFEPQGVSFFMINANPQDDRGSIKQESLDYGINIPILEDKSQVVTESLNITRTAEAVVVNPTDWAIVYRGAINSQFGYDTQTTGIGHQYLKDAIQAVLKHQPVSQPRTTVKGCLINLAGGRTDNPAFNEDVVPILSNKCLQCHVKGGIAPWSMDNYQKVKGWGAMIREVVRTGRMPPGQADPYYGNFKEESSLSPAEFRTLVHWIEQGSLNKDAGDSLAQAPRLSIDGWVLGQPDLIFTLKEEQSILPTGDDQFKFIEADKPVENDLWVRAVYWRPGNAKIVHHGNLVVQTPSQQDFPKDWFHDSGMDLETGQMIDGYSPGAGPFILPEGTGFFIPKGAKLFFRMHYITTGKPEQDRTQVGLYLYKNKPLHALSVFVISNRSIKIPPGAQEYKKSASHVLKDSVTLFAIQPHMHYRGRSMRFYVEYPDGKSEILLSVPNYRFRWQHRYILKEPKKLPAGSRITIEGSYDNSAQNPDNPDPTQEVVYGPLSNAEMFSGILYYVKEKDGS